MKLTVHMIANAHLDPVWLWTWPQGVDEALATCRAACDLLDEYGDLHVTRGEAWVHAQVERLAPDLFARIRAHVEAGRWHIVNGWWVQPDCNLPGAESFRMQGRIGGRWFRERLGAEVSVGYCVDSFGHCATLPRFLREAGMDSYVFLRPGPHEMELPANLFTWRAPASAGGPTGEAVTTFRITPGYTCWTVPALEKSIARAIEDASPGIGHTMCFFGIGDHGGGPTRAQVEWIRAHAQFAGDVHLRFSHPRAFFDAVAASGAALPLVEGELQHHAIGCYSVVREVKCQVRRAEDLAIQAACALERRPDADAGRDADAARRLESAWKKILFNQFHDILAGTSIAPAYEHARDELGLAKTVAREIVVDATRREIAQLPPCPRQRLHLVNLSERAFRGHLEFEPWIGEPVPPAAWPAAEAAVRLVDEGGAAVPCQRLRQHAAAAKPLRVVFPTQIDAGGSRTFELRRDSAPAAASPFRVEGAAVSGPDLALDLDATGIAAVRYPGLAAPPLGPGGVRVSAFEDRSDTWSHGLVAYDGPEAGVFRTDSPWRVIENGPLQVTMANDLALGASTLHWRVLLRAGEPVVRMRLRLHWHGRREVVKLLVPAGFAPRARVDGCPGGRIRRQCKGREWPVFDFVTLEGDGAFLALISADAYAADVGPDGLVRLTLLRSPFYAHHIPFEAAPEDGFPVTDQGVHEYEIALLAAPRAAWDEVEREVHQQTQPVWIGETTAGMSGGLPADRLVE